MDSILEAIELSAAAVIFCIAVYIFLMLISDMDKIGNEVYSYETENEICLYSEY